MHIIEIIKFIVLLSMLCYDSAITVFTFVYLQGMWRVTKQKRINQLIKRVWKPQNYITQVCDVCTSRYVYNCDESIGRFFCRGNGMLSLWLWNSIINWDVSGFLNFSLPLDIEYFKKIRIFLYQIDSSEHSDINKHNCH